MYSCASLAEARGCPIRIFTDQSLFAAPHDFSQRTTSFIASQCQGIHQMLLSRLMLSLSMSIRGVPPRQTERTDTDLRKTYMCSICLPQSGQALRPTYASTISRWHQRKLASKSLHSRCQSARRTPNAGRRNWSYEVSTAICRNAQHLLKGWWSQTGSNRRPEACKATALPTELWPRLTQHHPASLQGPTSIMVGLGRFELPTSRLSSARSNQLSYRPESHPAQVCDLERKRNVDGAWSANEPVTFRL